MNRKLGLPPPPLQSFTTGEREVSVYLTQDLREAKYFAKNAAKLRGQAPVVLSVVIPEDKKHLLQQDEKNPHAVRFVGTIPPEWIKKGSVRSVNDAKSGTTIHLVVFPSQALRDFNPNHVASGETGGQFTSGGGGSGAGEKAATGLLARLQVEGGFTYNTETGSSPKEGFVVSPYKAHEKVLDAASLTPMDLARYVVNEQSLLRQPDHYFGAWHNKDDGKVYLDVAIVKKSAQEAEQLSQKHNQLAYFDLVKMETVDVGRKKARADAYEGPIGGEGSGAVRTHQRSQGDRERTSGSEEDFEDEDGLEDFNPHHVTSGAQGGQFTTGSGGGSSETKASKTSSEAKTSKTTESTTPASDLLSKHAPYTIEHALAQLTPAQREAITKAEAAIAKGSPTNATVEKGGFVQPDGTYTPERQKLHLDIIKSELTPDIVAKARPLEGEKPVLTLLGGRPASGKTSSLKDNPVGGALYVSADTIQEKLPGYKPQLAGLFNGEAQDIALQVERMARGAKLNIVYDATLKSQLPAQERVDIYKKAGYHVDGFFTHTSPLTSAIRSIERFERSGRYVPMQVSLHSRTNEGTFDSLIPHFRKWAVYDNNGKERKLVAKGGEK